ncbi:SURF1 family protein [Caulobacter sp. UNC358MFTsu5.1]|uniref:SURF1 family protein n=1 Tax=Caulobacter sp. UNC358MFTsu5.1 TaxID=1449049 RepID=UPI0004A74FE1|nr:SURF1 family cytochrome oxidase biogenesis protein [Caulobacter sp. UNC358MFTsu5.1]
MSDAPAPKDRRFPIGLTIATLIAFAILCGLGTWQVKRLHWKEGLLKRIEALKTAPAQPLDVVLKAHRAPKDLEWTRVTTTCRPEGGFSFPIPPRYALRDGEIVWRAMDTCRPQGPNGPVFLVDRGYIEASSGAMTAPAFASAPPVQLTGILRTAAMPKMAMPSQAEIEKAAPPPSPKAEGADAVVDEIIITGQRFEPMMIVVEHETPAAPGLTPAPLPAEISNRHLEYALTWFGLAVTLLFIYAAMLWRKMRS